MSAPAAQLGLTLRPPRSPRIVRAAAARAVDPAVRLALSLLLHARHQGRSRAATWEALRDELAVEGLEVGVVRRLQEAAEELLEEGAPIVGMSAAGVFWAETAEEIEQSLAETEKRARKTLRRRRLLRRALLAMRGQESIPAVEEPVP